MWNILQYAGWSSDATKKWLAFPTSHVTDDTPRIFWHCSISDSTSFQQGLAAWEHLAVCLLLGGFTCWRISGFPDENLPIPSTSASPEPGSFTHFSNCCVMWWNGRFIQSVKEHVSAWSVSSSDTMRRSWQPQLCPKASLCVCNTHLRIPQRRGRHMVRLKISRGNQIPFCLYNNMSLTKKEI